MFYISLLNFYVTCLQVSDRRNYEDEEEDCGLTFALDKRDPEKDSKEPQRKLSTINEILRQEDAVVDIKDVPDVAVPLLDSGKTRSMEGLSSKLRGSRESLADKIRGSRDSLLDKLGLKESKDNLAENSAKRDNKENLADNAGNSGLEDVVSAESGV